MRIGIATAVLLAGCAAPDGAGFVLLESESYRCGAAEGLGCGLAIAPVLERIDELDGVAGSRVSWDGRYFRIEVLPGSDRERVASEAAVLLDGEACCVTAARGKAAPGPPDRWFDEEATVELSRHEAGVIAAYAALLEPRISEVMAVDPPASHHDGPIFLNVLRVMDVPEAFGMLAPRPLTIATGQAGEFARAQSLYRVGGGTLRMESLP